MNASAPDRIASDLSYELSCISDRDAFFAATAEMLTAVFRCDGVAWTQLDVNVGTAIVRGTPLELENVSTASMLAHHAPDHPIIRSYMANPDTSPRRISDVASHAELLRTGSYTEVMRPLGINFQLSIMTIRSGGLSGGGWALSRELRDFSEDHLEMAGKIQAVLSLLTYTAQPRRAVHADAQERLRLTSREVEVICLIADGHTARAVGHLLRIAPTTVRKHLERVYAKLGVSDRLMAVRRAQEAGLLDIASVPRQRSND